MNDMSPIQEWAKRAGEIYPGLQGAGLAVGLQDHQRMLRDHARRLLDGHKAQMKAAGFSDLAEADGGDDMGDILVTGDITVTNPQQPAPQAIPQASPQAAQAEPTDSSLPGWVKSLALTGGMLGSAIGGAGLASILSGPDGAEVVQPPAQEVPEFNDTNTQYELQLVKPEQPQ